MATASPSKAAAKKAADSKKEVKTPRSAKVWTKEFQDRVVALRSEGVKWNEIAEAVDSTEGMALQAYDIATCPAKEKVKNAGPAEIKALRERPLSWGQIVARTGYPESKCRSLYADAGGNLDRIGKGGRHAGDVSSNGDAAPKAAKKAGMTKVEAKPKQSPLANLTTTEEFTEALVGKTIKVAPEGKAEYTFKVGEVKKFVAKSGMLSLVDEATGSARAVKVAEIKGRSK